MKLDSQLMFSEHANYIRSKTFTKIKFLGRIRNNLDQSTATMLYQTLILPIFDYGDIIYNCLSQKDAVMLQRLQNMSLKTILKANKRTSTAAIHDELNITLGTRCNMHCATQMYRVQQNLVPQTVAEMFQPVVPSGNITTQSDKRNNYIIPHCRLDFG